MLKSSRIPPLLNRICNNGISSAYLITTDGALLGASSYTASEMKQVVTSTSSSSSPVTSSSFHPHPMDPSDLASLVAEVMEDYKKLGSELSLLKKKEDLMAVHATNTSSLTPNAPPSINNNMTSSSTASSVELKKDKFCILIELEKGLLGIASATDTTYVVALGEGVEHGWLKMQLYALAAHVRDSGMY